MPRASANGIEIEYETFGPGSADPLLLVMGLGTQLVGWDEAFCEGLAERGHFVVRYDNRDVGLSTHFHDASGMSPVEAMAASFEGRPIDAPYRLSDMAADGIGLLDALGLDRAHVVGASMGGMIVQTMAIEHADRVQTMTSIMSTTGDPALPPAKPEITALLVRPPATSKDEAIQATVDSFQVFGSPGFPFEEERLRRRAARAYDRCFDPSGQARQLTAVVAGGDRSDGLRGVTTPTLVIHGEEDPLIPPSGGRDTQEKIPGARGLFIPGMGHDLPTPLWPQLIEAIAKLASDHPIA